VSFSTNTTQKATSVTDYTKGNQRRVRSNTNPQVPNQVPIIPFDWLQELVADGGDSFKGSENSIKLREWVTGVLNNNQLISHQTGRDSDDKRLSPYVSSPGTANGNPIDPVNSMLRSNNAGSSEAESIATNMLKHMSNFFSSSNIDREVRNLVPAISRHCMKMPDFEPLFNMRPVCNVKFFLGLLFTDQELRQMPQDIFTSVLDDKPPTGQFARMEKAPEGLTTRTL
jgi:hypothetical protein